MLSVTARSTWRTVQSSPSLQLMLSQHPSSSTKNAWPQHGTSGSDRSRIVVVAQHAQQQNTRRSNGQSAMVPNLVSDLHFDCQRSPETA